ncbi:MAG: hypothetical protein MUC83_17520 [Pirellula sp.]|nr:hypothetical protein [Pirellula sp.]
MSLLSFCVRSFCLYKGYCLVRPIDFLKWFVCSTLPFQIVFIRGEAVSLNPYERITDEVGNAYYIRSTLSNKSIQSLDRIGAGKVVNTMQFGQQ